MEGYLALFSAVMFIIGVYSFIATLLILRHFRKLGNVNDETDGPLICVIIPARNE